MARPRIFVSSTYYDLKHLRSSLENFVKSLGFDAVLSEKGKIAYTPDVPLDESCYREVGTADIFVLIVGGRYGSEVSATRTALLKTFFDRYNSITRGEYNAALDRDVPTYVLIERSVCAEYETYLKNKDNNEITYAHVDSVNIFDLLKRFFPNREIILYNSLIVIVKSNHGCENNGQDYFGNCFSAYRDKHNWRPFKIKWHS